MIIETLQWSNFIPILRGTVVTILLCSFSTLFGSMIGFLLGLGATSKKKFLRLICGAYVRIIRGIPLLMIIFMIYYAVPLLSPGLSLSQGFAALFSLSIYAGAYLGEIVRGSMLSIDKGQYEAADALGLNYWQKITTIILPQAFKHMLPPGIGFVIALVKDSSLVSIIGYIDLTRAGTILSNITYNPILIFSIVAFIYFMICYVLSKVASYFENRNMNYVN